MSGGDDFCKENFTKKGTNYNGKYHYLLKKDGKTLFELYFWAFKMKGDIYAYISACPLEKTRLVGDLELTFVFDNDEIVKYSDRYSFQDDKSWFSIPYLRYRSGKRVTLFDDFVKITNGRIVKVIFNNGKETLEADVSEETSNTINQLIPCFLSW